MTDRPHLQVIDGNPDYDRMKAREWSQAPLAESPASFGDSASDLRAQRDALDRKCGQLTVLLTVSWILFLILWVQ